MLGAELLEEIYGLVWNVQNQEFAIFLDIDDRVLGIQLFDVDQSALVVVQMFQLDFQVVLVFHMLLAELERLRKVARLSQHLDGRVDIELYILLHQEIVQTSFVFELSVAVEQQSSVVFIGQFEFVKLLQIVGQVDNSLRIEELKRRKFNRRSPGLV